MSNRIRYIDVSTTLRGKDADGNTISMTLVTEQVILGELIPTSVPGRDVLVVAGNHFPMVASASFIDEDEIQEAKDISDASENDADDDLS